MPLRAVVRVYVILRGQAADARKGVSGKAHRTGTPRAAEHSCPQLAKASARTQSRQPRSTVADLPASRLAQALLSFGRVDFNDRRPYDLNEP